MTLNSEGLEKAYKAAEQIDGEWVALRPNMVEAVVSAYLAALPPVDGMEVVAWDVAPKGLPAEPTKSHSFVAEIEKQGGVILPLVTLSQASSVIAGLKEEVERCHARLEIDHEWVVGGNDDSSLERREIPMADRANQIDGIECRDATITELERDIERLTKERDEARAYASESTTAKLEGANTTLLARISSLEEENKRLRKALKQQIPGHRDPEGNCWCRYGHNPDYGHTLSCVAARQVLGDHNG